VAHPPVDLPPRERVVAEVNAALAGSGVQAAAVNIHYLSTGFDVEIVLPARTLGRDNAQRLGAVDLAALKRRLGVRKLEVLEELEVSQGETGLSTQTQARTGVDVVDRTKTTEPHSTG
jgi:hypothetical protein